MSRRILSTLYLFQIRDIATNLDLGALDLGVEPVVRGKGDRQKGSGDDTGYGGEGQRHRGARHLGCFISDVCPPRALFLLDRLPLASPHTHRATYVLTYYRLRGHPRTFRGRKSCHTKRVTARCVFTDETKRRRAGPRERALENARTKGDHRDSRRRRKGLRGSSEAPANPGISVDGRRVRPSGCVLHRDAHHSTVPLATATTLTARLASKESQSREPAERARRENRTPGGDGLVASGRYITCVLPAAVLNARDLPHLASRSSGKISSFGKKIRYPFAGIPQTSDRHSRCKCYYSTAETRYDYDIFLLK